MNRVFQIVEYGEKFPYQFTSKANSTEGVFRSFSKTHIKFLKPDTLYFLYGAVNFGFQKIAAAFWNGKAFVSVVTKIENHDLFLEFLSNNKDFNITYKPSFARIGDTFINEVKKEFEK